MYNIFNTLRHLAGNLSLMAALGAAAMLSTSCNDDLLYEKEITMNADGTFGPFDLEVKIDAEGSDSRTRSGFGVDNLKIKNVWLLMFDSQEGKLLAISNNNFGDGDATDTNHGATQDSNGKNLVCKLNSIMFSNRVNSAYIVGVANTEGVKAVDKDGQDVALDSVIFHIKNSVDFKNIIVDNASAERAMAQVNAPLMSGLWGTAHYNYTMNLTGKVYGNVASPSSGVADEFALIPLYDENLKVKAKERVDGGMIHLRRLYSHLNVTVNFDVDDDPSKGKAFKSVSDPTVEICNMPKYTFLQEHKTVENSEAYDAKIPDANGRIWKDATHTGAHLMPGTSLVSTGEIKVGEKVNYYEKVEDAALIMNDEDVVSITGNQLKFGYWHYETKHWGLSNVKTVNDREKMFDGGKYFSSLCPSPDKTFNNDAPYFVIRANVETHDGYKGKAEFVVHEGYCCSPNSAAATDEAVKARDFCTFRNTNYEYTVNIHSINGYKLKVESEDMSGKSGYSGTGGEMWSVSPKNVKVVRGASEHEITIPAGKFYWCISEDDKAPYGISMASDYDNYIMYGDAYPKNITDVTSGIGDFYDNITLDGMPLGSISNFNTEATHKLKFSGQTSINGYLYLLGIHTSADKTATYYTVFKFNQDGTEIDIPSLSMDNSPASGKIIIGIDDHSIFWDPIAGAESYTISLGTIQVGTGTGGGYTITLQPGVPVNDGGYNVVLEETPNGKLKFTMRYAKSKGGMLSLVDEGQNIIYGVANFSVIANGSNGKSSKPGIISCNVINPYWQFYNNNDWANGVASLQTTNIEKENGLAANQELKINGLTMYTGSSNKMTFEAHGSYMTFRPGGSGNRTRLGFKFHAFANGKINVWTSSTTSSAGTGRYLATTQTGADGKFVETQLTTWNANGTKSGTQGKSPDILIDPVEKSGLEDNVWIYSLQDVLFYRIIFTPQDR